MPTTDLSHEIALVTGATGGIGKATVLALARAGCGAIAVCYGSDKDGAEKLCRDIESECGAKVKTAAFQVDVGHYDSVRALHVSVTSTLGDPTILYNNAGGTSGKWGVTSAADISIDDFERTWRLNCGSAYLLTQLCLPAMEARGWGRVAFCSSIAAFIGGVVGPDYASSKSALHGLIHWLSQYYCKKGITVNGIAPALIGNTKMVPGTNEELAAKIPVGHFGSPDEVADVFMLMVRSGYITNKIYGIDGGMFAH